jgi:hypothetical protein
MLIPKISILIFKFQKMRGYISQKDGTLVIDLTVPQDNYTNAADIFFYIDQKSVLHLSYNTFKWRYFDDRQFSDYNINDQDFLRKVKPMYIEQYIKKSSWYNRLLIKIGVKYKHTEISRRIKSGWVEFRDSNLPIKITTSQFLIKQIKF